LINGPEPGPSWWRKAQRLGRPITTEPETFRSRPPGRGAGRCSACGARVFGTAQRLEGAEHRGEERASPEWRGPGWSYGWGLPEWGCGRETTNPTARRCTPGRQPSTDDILAPRAGCQGNSSPRPPRAKTPRRAPVWSLTGCVPRRMEARHSETAPGGRPSCPKGTAPPPALQKRQFHRPRRPMLPQRTVPAGPPWPSGWSGRGPCRVLRPESNGRWPLAEGRAPPALRPNIRLSIWTMQTVV
jgi:hypothetical protein